LVKESSVSQSELRYALAIAAPAIFLVVVSSGVSCTFEAFQRFDYSNALRMIVGAGTVAGTTLASLFTIKLSVLALVLVLSRLIALSFGLVLLSSLLKPYRCGVFVRKYDIAELVRFGRWITAANLMGPLLAYGDRFALSTLVPAANIAYYLVPYDLLARILVLPNAFVSSLFPRFSMHSEVSALSNLLRKATLCVFVTMAAALATAGVVAHPALSIWISPAFAGQSFRIAQILCAGVLLNSLASIPFGFLQAQGWAKQLVLAQLCEVPAYLLALHLGGSLRGASGIAIAWSGRMFVDAALLWALVWRKFRLAR
jgi:O-antigen/teichoic acid export membrane protein